MSTSRPAMTHRTCCSPLSRSCAKFVLEITHSLSVPGIAEGFVRRKSADTKCEHRSCKRGEAKRCKGRSQMAKDDPAKVAADGDDQDEIWPLETDSVDAQFGGEYSEETLRMVRGYPKPTWLEEPSVSFAFHYRY